MNLIFSCIPCLLLSGKYKNFKFYRLKSVIKEWHSSPIYIYGGLDGEESACGEGDLGLIPGLGRSPGEGNGNPTTPVFLPGEFHGQRNLAGYSP